MALRSLSLLALAGLLLTAGPAAAFSDAKVDAKLTPNFGALLKPPIRHAKRHHHGWKPLNRETYRYYDQGYGYGPDYGYGYGYGYGYQQAAQVLSVDCGSTAAGPRPINDALGRLATGGSLYIKGAGACRETVEILRPVTIVGEETSAFDTAPSGRATINAPPGQPCIFIAPGVLRVEIRGLKLLSERPGRAGCIEGQDAQFALVNTEITYAGTESAVWSAGGRMILRGVRIEAPHAETGVLVDQSVIQVEGGQITAGGLGMDITVDAREQSLMSGMVITGPGLGAPGALRSTGLLVRGGYGPTRLDIRGGYVDGFATGMWFDNGAAVDVSSTSVRRTQTAVIVDGGDVRITDSRLGARDTVVWVASGRAVVDNNVLYGYLRQAVSVARGAFFSGRNKLYPRKGCAGPDLREACQPMGLLEPELRDDDNGWGPPPAMRNPRGGRDWR